MNKIYKFFSKYKSIIIDVSVLIAIFCYLSSYFEPKYLLLKTIITGGDTASHYYYAEYLRDTLIPQGKIMGWIQGNYCGFPLFLFYFPFPFIVSAFISYVIPLEIAFKIVTVLGIFSLPFCTYYGLRFLRYSFPVPIIGAVFALPFLFMEANSMWGANIPSTLAGEFTYSWGFSLTILFAGTLYRGITTNRLVIINAVLVFLIGFSHGYTLLFAIIMSSFFLITVDDFFKKLIYLLKMHLLGFCMLAFWLVPLIFNTPYTTRYNFIWNIDSIFTVLPKILIPFIALAGIGLIVDLVQKVRDKAWNDRENLDNRVYYFWFCIVVSTIFYFIAYRINVVDIRFLPFLQFFFMIGGAVGIYKIIEKLRYQWLVPLMVVPITFLWVENNVKYIDKWISWNYEGFESKNVWPSFSAVNNYLSGSVSDPRVVYEHSSLHNSAGTVRAFESIPLFSGRPTLEGLYMQSSITSPFVFYIQSEISKQRSAPLPDYSCTQFNLKKGINHLEMFNVKDFIVRSQEVKKAIKDYPQFLHKKTFGPYQIYELTSNENRYVVPLKYKPVLLETDNWKMLFYKWFKNHEQNDVHIVLEKGFNKDEVDLARFGIIGEDELNNLPKIPLDISGYIKEEIKDDEILIETDMINKPILVKFSYHPNWRVEGADRIYLVSPSFMLIYPDNEHVRLYYGRTFPNYLGNFLSIAVILGFAIYIPVTLKRRKKEKLNKGNPATVIYIDPIELLKITPKVRLVILLFCLSIITISLSLFIVFVKQKDPNIMYTKGMRLFDKKEYDEASSEFLAIMAEYPDAAKASNAAYFYAICFFKREDYKKTIDAFEKLIVDYHDSVWVPEAYYHIGLCKYKIAQIIPNNETMMQEAKTTFEYVIAQFPTSRWKKYSEEKLMQVDFAKHKDPNVIYADAIQLFDKKRYAEASALFLSIINGAPENVLASNAAYHYAICFFKREDYNKAIEAFGRLIDDYPDSVWVAEAYYHVGICSLRIANSLPPDNDVLQEAVDLFKYVISQFPTSRWRKFSEEKLEQIKKRNDSSLD